MSNSAVRTRSVPRGRWLLVAALPAMVIAAQFGINAAHADSDDDSESRSATEAVSDGWITAQVKTRLLADQKVSGFDISVETRDGEVELSGEVESQEQVDKAVEIAEKVEGVENVDAVSLRISTAVDQMRDAAGFDERD